MQDLLSQELERINAELDLRNEELERARQETAAARQRYVELYDESPVAYLTLDECGRVIAANVAASVLLGIDRARLLQRPLSAFMRSADTHGFHLFREDARSTRQESSCEVAIRCGGGNYRVVRLVVNTSSEGDGRQCRCTLLDLSELRSAEDARHAAESNAQAVLDAAPDAIVTIDLAGRIVSLNAAAEGTFGYRHDELVSQPVETLMPSRYRQEYLGHVRRYVTTGEAKVIGRPGPIVRGLRKDGSEVPLELNIAEWHGRGQRMFTAVLRDVSDRENALARLRATEERFALITEHLEDVFYIADTDGAVVYLSPAYERIWGRRADDDRRSRARWPIALAPDDHAEVESGRASLPSGHPLEIEYRILGAGGKARWIRDRAFPIRDAQGRVTRIVGIAEDRTAEFELELELGQARKMETIGTLSSGMAHDFNNVLQVIVGATSLAADETTPTDKAREFLLRAKEVALRGAEVVHRITGFARKQHVPRRPLPVDRVLRDMALLLEPLLGEHIALVVLLGAPDVLVLAAQAQLEQIVLNLASNSRDAMPNGGGFTVRTEAGTDPLSGVRIIVTDTGVGMDDETKTRVFNPFFTTKRPGKGTGLGLTTVRAVVEQLGGDVHVESRPGEGTTFTISLPTCEPQSVLPPALDADACFRGTALLVEDEPVVRRAVRRQLQRLGLEVLESESGPRALAIVNEVGQKRPDILVSDVLMPGMTGPQLAAELRRTHPQLPVLFISGDPGGALDETNLDGRTRLLPKPFDRADLIDELGELLAPPRPLTEIVPARRRSSTLLLVEDEEGARHSLRKLLADATLHVLTAKSVAEACAAANLFAFDVLLTDLHLPDGDGDALAEKLSGLQPDIRVIYMSGEPRSTDRLLGPHVEKPVDAARLRALIDQVVAGVDDARARS